MPGYLYCSECISPCRSQAVVLATGRRDISMGLSRDTEADRYDVDVESAFNKQRRKRG